MEPTEATAQVTAVEHPAGEFIESDFNRLLEHEPNPITAFVPDNAAEQKRAFLAGEIDGPDHHYPKLDSLNATIDRVVIKETINDIISQPDVDPKFIPAYEEFGEENLKKLDLLELAKRYKEAQTEEEKHAIGEEYMRVNVELYGAPDEEKYHQMVAYQLSKIKVDELGPEAKQEYDTLLAMLPGIDLSKAQDIYRPQQETIEWVKAVVEGLFENMLAHVPEDRDDFTAEDIRDTFEEVIREEFVSKDEEGNIIPGSNAAEGWQVIIADVTSITVNAAKKTVFVNRSHANVNRKTMRKLVVHELGDHFLRSVTGGETNLPLLARGITGYYDFEEGIGRAFEQALDGKYEPGGIDYYIVAGSMYLDKKNFKETQEIMWRLSALGKGKDFTDSQAIDLSKGSAYNAVNRLTRGTDELPWLKDLGYSKTEEVWKYFDKIRGDYFALEMLLATGRYNPTIEKDANIVLETASRE